MILFKHPCYLYRVEDPPDRDRDEEPPDEYPERPASLAVRSMSFNSGGLTTIFGGA